MGAMEIKSGISGIWWWFLLHILQMTKNAEIIPKEIELIAKISREVYSNYVWGGIRDEKK
jgi:hypothetical protein